MEKTLRFVWFWTFWHWSRESWRAGQPRGEPLTGIADNWTEWFTQLASEQDRAAIDELGQKRGAQSQFVAWLFRHWANEASYGSGRSVPRFTVGQLARVLPFSTWPAMARFRDGYGLTGVPAIILSEQSTGRAADVRSIEALVLPTQDPARKGEVVPEGFKANATELRIPARLARDVLGGKAGRMLLFLWLLAGRRRHRRLISTALQLGWLSAAGLLLWLRFGSDPEGSLPALETTLLALWATLVTGGAWSALREARNFRREGRSWSRQLSEGEMRLRTNIGLMVEGGSAGLPFALNTMLASYRSGPATIPRSWIWRRIFTALDRNGRQWAATGVVTPGGWIGPVVLAPKLRACFQHPGITHILTPVQRAATSRDVAGIRETLGSVPPEPQADSAVLDAPRYGFASGPRNMRVRPCRHIAQALLSVSCLVSRRQLAVNVVALVLTATIFVAAPDLRGTLLPLPPPAVTTPASPSPYYLWVTLDTPHASDFSVVLESRYWTNRRAEVVAHGGPGGSTRAEIRLLRFSHTRSNNPEDGIVWIERRRKLLWREYAPGERVGQFSLSYLNRLGRE